MGIICGLELARMMQEDNLSLQHPFEVIATVEEEGNSFSSGILGGKALSGLLETDYLKQLTNNARRHRLRCHEGLRLDPG